MESAPVFEPAWQTALTIDDYLAQLWRKHRARFARNRDRTQVPEGVRARLAGRPLRVLVLTEPWCEDSAQFVPAIWKLTLELPEVELRVLREHEHRELAARYHNQAGHPAIPTIVLLDEELRELGALVERPPRVNAALAAEARHFVQAHPELPGIRRTLDRMPEETSAALKAHIAQWRDTQHEVWVAWLLEELAEIATARASPSSRAGN